MTDFEGSVNMEGFDEIDEESTSEENSENINNSGNETETEATEETKETSETSEDEVQYTEKGTKLDPNPQSAIHQELANAKREAEEYRQFMSNPKQLKKYLEELEEELGEKTGETKSEIQDRAEDQNLITDPDLIETPQDLKSYIKFLTQGVEKTKQELINERNSIKQEATERAINERLISDIDSLQSKYPFLNPNNPDQFDKELEREIAEQYEELDKDPRTGKYLGRISITAIAERAIRIRKLGEATGSKNAQTTVLDKRHGAVKTGSGQSGGSDEKGMSAAQLIASRMQRARGNR